MKSISSFLTTVLAFTLWGTLSVHADYYMEFKAPPPNAPSSSRSQAVMVPVLYECKGIPRGTTAFTTGVSQCNPVTSAQEKARISTTCTFYTVYRPKLQGHVMQLSDRRTAHFQEWNLGYINHAPDHPNFAEPNQDDIQHFYNKLQPLGIDILVPNYLIDSLSYYFAQNNLVAFSINAVSANSYLLNFTAFIKRALEHHRNIDQRVRWLDDNLPNRRQIDSALKMIFHKMIDPCSILFDNLQKFASGYCATYCNYLNVMARQAGTACSKCSSLRGGQCVGVVCQCIRVMTHPFSGCMFSPMQQCHSVIRNELKW